MVKAYVESKKFNVLYGDTDSLYICAPHYVFETLDADYEAGRINKLTYWTRMIEITMETLDSFKNEVNNMIMINNCSPFLKMAYEEVLWPFVMAGKKKYIGVQHMGIVNLNPCMPEFSLAEFMKPGLIFIRGLEIIKRGSSDFLKQVCFEVFKEAFCLTETRTLKQIVENKMQDISERKWDPNMFAKSAKYKLPTRNAKTGAMNPGNVSVLRFVDRMTEFEKSYPNMGIKAPEIGDRFTYAVVKRYPWKYDFRGNQKDDQNSLNIDY
jgi:DNA polymerase elongation subunit (family B)